MTDGKKKISDRVIIAAIGLCTGLVGSFGGSFFEKEVVKDIDQLFKEMDTKASIKEVDQMNVRFTQAVISNGMLIHENEKELTKVKVDVAKLE